MRFEVVEDANDVTRIILTGRMDVAGSLAVDDQFRTVSETKRKIIVDLSGVEFLASLGMRTLVTGAKAVMREHGKMVIMNPQRDVEQALKTAYIDSLIPVVHDLGAANALLS